MEKYCVDGEIMKDGVAVDGEITVKKYQIGMRPLVTSFPTDNDNCTTYVEIGMGFVAIYTGKPKNITSTMCPVPESWKGKSIKFNGYAAL